MKMDVSLLLNCIKYDDYVIDHMLNMFIRLKLEDDKCMIRK